MLSLSRGGMVSTACVCGTLFLLLWRQGDDGIEVLIVHPGGPFWARKQQGAWSIPKGEFDPEAEDGPAAAAREFTEELGNPAPPQPCIVKVFGPGQEDG